MKLVPKLESRYSSHDKQADGQSVPAPQPIPRQPGFTSPKLPATTLDPAAISERTTSTSVVGLGTKLFG